MTTLKLTEELGLAELTSRCLRTLIGKSSEQPQLDKELRIRMLACYEEMLEEEVSLSR